MASIDVVQTSDISRHGLKLCSNAALPSASATNTLSEPSRAPSGRSSVPENGVVGGSAMNACHIV